MDKKRIVVLTGAGISAESGIHTFRGADGLWEGHKVEDIASPEGWQKNQKLVLDFYNQRRRQLLTVETNAAHTALVELEKKYEVNIITQNVDDLHERAGSANVMHLHGELLKARSTQYPYLVYDRREDIVEGDNCEKGGQLRPHIVWFGEAVPLIEEAANLCMAADIVIVIGTSLVVYPAAGLLEYAPVFADKYLINLEETSTPPMRNLRVIINKATVAVPHLVVQLLSDAR
jgi:NAD-dependent deacetylase